MRDDVLFFRAAFLRHEPQRYALMLSPEDSQRLNQKYDEKRGEITGLMIRQHLAGEIALAAPAAIDGRAHLLPLDVDAGGLPAIQALIRASAQRGYWSFGQYCPRPNLPENQQRGYGWLSSDEDVEAARLQLLGEQLITASHQDDWKVEARAHAAVTRLPLARHAHTKQFGYLVFADQLINIDADPPLARAALRRRYRENTIRDLPPLPAEPKPEQKKQQEEQERPQITIDSYNQDNNLIALLEHYGARHAAGSRRLLHCCGHPDQRRASLLLWKGRGDRLFCKCLSEHHNCPLSGQMRDAFGVYCAMEHLTAEQALRRLNGWE